MGPFELLLAMNVLLSSRVLGDVRSCPPANCQYEDSNRTCHLSLDTITACSCPTCEADSTFSGSFKPDSLKVALNYTARLQADVIVTWDYLSEYIPSGETAFEISHHVSDGKRGTVCFCLPNMVSMVIAPLSQLVNVPQSILPDYCFDSHVDQVAVTLRIGVERLGIDSSRNLSSNVTVRDCFETVGSSENTVCGKDMPRAPVNAKATVIGQSPGKTVVTVTWEHAEGGVKADWYDLDFMSNLLYVLFLDVPGNTTQQTVTINQTLTPSSGAYFKIRSGGYSYEKDEYGDCLCLERNLPQPVLFCHGTNATLLFPGPSGLNVHFIFWPVLAGIVMVVMVITVIICILWRYRRWTEGPIPYVMQPSPDDAELEVREQGTIFLVASTEENELVKRRIRHLCSVLGENGLTYVYYEYVANDHSEDSPSAMGMNRWVERQFSRCEFVLFVCTKRFLEEWNGERRDILSPLVYPCRNLLDGSLTRPQNISKFAVLFMGDGHNVPPVMGCFRQFDVFKVGSDDIHTDSLIRYLLEVPRFAKPRIVNFFRQFV